MPRRVIIDADVFVYKYANAYQRTVNLIYKDPETGERMQGGVNVVRSDTVAALEQVDAAIYRVKRDTHAQAVQVVLSSLGSYWRSAVYGGYKDNRGGKTKPQLYHPIRKHLEEQHHAVILDRLEGDDTLSLALFEPFAGDTVVASIDKDLLTVPGLHYNWDKPQQGIIEVSEWEALHWFYQQALQGDPVDGYPGAKNVGKVRALKILNEAQGMTEKDEPLESAEDYCEKSAWYAVVAAYKKAGQTERHALLNARCAHLLVPGEYHYETKVVRLWQPPHLRDTRETV